MAVNTVAIVSLVVLTVRDPRGQGRDRPLRPTLAGPALERATTDLAASPALAGRPDGTPPSVTQADPLAGAISAFLGRSDGLFRTGQPSPGPTEQQPTSPPRLPASGEPPGPLPTAGSGLTGRPRPVEARGEVGAVPPEPLRAIGSSTGRAVGPRRAGGGSGRRPGGADGGRGGSGPGCGRRASEATGEPSRGEARRAGSGGRDRGDRRHRPARPGDRGTAPGADPGPRLGRGRRVGPFLGRAAGHVDRRRRRRGQPAGRQLRCLARRPRPRPFAWISKPPICRAASRPPTPTRPATPAPSDAGRRCRGPDGRPRSLRVDARR